MAISAGVSARMGRPMGVVMRARSSSVKPRRFSSALTAAIFFRLPMTPMYRAGVRRAKAWQSVSFLWPRVMMQM